MASIIGVIILYKNLTSVNVQEHNITGIVCMRIQNGRYTYTWLVMYRFNTMIAEQNIFVL